MSKLQIKSRVENIRKEMKKHDLDAFYIPRADQFQNEYVPPCNSRLLQMTNFSGSAGSALIGKSTAAFFTDGRYTLQAIDEVPSDVFEIYSISPDQKPTPTLNPDEWIEDKLPQGARVGFDPWIITPTDYDRLHKAVAAKGGELVAVPNNLVDAVWDKRPNAPQEKISVHDMKYAGESHDDKIIRMAATLKKENCCALVMTFPEEIAWLLNIRGNDVAFNPLPLCYGILYNTGEMDLFVDPAKVTDELKSHLGDNVKLRAFEDFENALHDLRGDVNKVWIDPKTSPYAVKSKLTADHLTLHEDRSPIQMAKAIKNKVEQKGTINAHIRDGVALTRYLYRLSGQSYVGNNSEISASDELQRLREENELFKDLSFDTISGAGAAGAIIHYRSTAESDKPLTSGPLYLCDSGGQYLDGTTDVTRTVAVDTPSPEMIENFTRVLKGHIQVAMAKFPKGTTGKPLDEKARAALVEVGLNYAHGTGHGVGSYLCVHEGPCGIHSRSEVALEPGMILSNEPGYYKNGEYGIRIENLVLVVDTGEKDSDGNPLYGFKDLTMAPIDRNCIDADLLTPAEKQWLDDYHATVYKTLKPHLEKVEPKAAEWLKEVTKPIDPPAKKPRAPQPGKTPKP